MHEAAQHGPVGHCRDAGRLCWGGGKQGALGHCSRLVAEAEVRGHTRGNGARRTWIRGQDGLVPQGSTAQRMQRRWGRQKCAKGQVARGRKESRCTFNSHEALAREMRGVPCGAPSPKVRGSPAPRTAPDPANMTSRSSPRHQLLAHLHTSSISCSSGSSSNVRLKYVSHVTFAHEGTRRASLLAQVQSPLHGRPCGASTSERYQNSGHT